MDGHEMYYQVPLDISKQEDGLWRVEAPSLPGCFVDEATLADALHEIHEVVAMFLDVYQEEGRSLPDGVKEGTTLPVYATIPVATDEVAFDRVLPDGSRVAVPPRSRAKSPRRKKRLDT